MARHFGCVIIPARPKSPKDKAVAENHVLAVQRWILARLRNRQVFSLPELNAAIAELLVELNQMLSARVMAAAASTPRD